MRYPVQSKLLQSQGRIQTNSAVEDFIFKRRNGCEVGLLRSFDVFEVILVSSGFCENNSHV